MCKGKIIQTPEGLEYSTQLGRMVSLTMKIKTIELANCLDEINISWLLSKPFMYTEHEFYAKGIYKEKKYYQGPNEYSYATLKTNFSSSPIMLRMDNTTLFFTNKSELDIVHLIRTWCYDAFLNQCCLSIKRIQKLSNANGFLREQKEIAQNTKPIQLYTLFIQNVDGPILLCYNFRITVSKGEERYEKKTEYISGDGLSASSGDSVLYNEFQRDCQQYLDEIPLESGFPCDGMRKRIQGHVVQLQNIRLFGQRGKTVADISF